MARNHLNGLVAISNVWKLQIDAFISHTSSPPLQAIGILHNIPFLRWLIRIIVVIQKPVTRFAVGHLVSWLVVCNVHLAPSLILSLPSNGTPKDKVIVVTPRWHHSYGVVSKPNTFIVSFGRFGVFARDNVQVGSIKTHKVKECSLYKTKESTKWAIMIYSKPSHIAKATTRDNRPILLPTSPLNALLTLVAPGPEIAGT